MNNQDYQYISTNDNIQQIIKDYTRKLNNDVYRNMRYITTEDIRQDLLLKAISIIPAYKTKYGTSTINSKRFNAYMNKSFNRYMINEGIRMKTKLVSRSINPERQEEQAVLQSLSKFFASLCTEDSKFLQSLDGDQVTIWETIINNPASYIKVKSGRININKLSKDLSITRPRANKLIKEIKKNAEKK